MTITMPRLAILCRLKQAMVLPCPQFSMRTTEQQSTLKLAWLRSTRAQHLAAYVVAVDLLNQSVRNCARRKEALIREEHLYVFRWRKVQLRVEEVNILLELLFDVLNRLQFGRLGR
mmetsp:Transcript_40930/g.162092  ORF Transcript_40930/g.162092 Transcript_40930/m.162092 type:complete len:116 (-) Transcript_40930:1845-2192(-)